MKKGIPFFLILSPLIYLLIYTVYYHVNIPWGDQWIMCFNYFRESEDGFTILRRLWIPHNSHRLFFPKSIMLCMGYLSHWNIGWEIAVNILLSAMSFGVLWLYLKRLSGSVRFYGFPVLLFGLSVMVFSLSQWENFLWGWQIAIFLNIFSVLLGFYLVSGERFGTGNFIFAMILGFIGTHSFGTGLAFWPVCFILLLFRKIDSRELKMRVLVLFAVITVLVIFSYSYGLMFNPYMAKSQGTMHQLAGKPLYFTHFFLVLMGSPIANYHSGLSALWGFSGIIGFFSLCYFVLKEKEVNRHLVLPVIGFGLYALIGAFLIAMGRARLNGVAPALNSRYITITNLLWMSDFILLFILISSKKFVLNKAVLKTGVMVVLCVWVLSISVSYYKGMRDGRRHSKMMQHAKEHILAGYPDNLDDKVLGNLLPFTKFVRSGITILKDKKLTFYSDQKMKGSG